MNSSDENMNSGEESENMNSGEESENMNSGEESENMELMSERDSDGGEFDPSEKLFSPWSNLPPIVIENVYSFLGRKDQLSMSLVCRNWSSEYNCPKLWRRMEFQLPNRECNMEICPEIHFAKNFASSFHHVKIIYKEVRTRLLYAVYSKLKQFLQYLTEQSQLRTIVFTNMGKYFRSLDTDLYNDTCNAIQTFLITQKRLVSLEFRNAQIKPNEAAEILKAIFEINTVEQLLLKGFLDELYEGDIDEHVFDVEVALKAILNLRTWEMDYTAVFEQIVLLLSTFENLPHQMAKGHLENLTLHCNGSKDITYRGIPPQAWNFFSLLCPDMRINLSYRSGAFVRNAVDLFVVQDMPVRSLSLELDDESVDPILVDVGTLFRHIVSCNIHIFLEDLSIAWLRSQENLVQELLSFLRVSPKLKVLQLCALHPVQALDTLFNTWLENGAAGLTNVHITIANVPTEEDKEIYMSVADYFYAPLLMHGLNLILIADPA